MGVREKLGVCCRFYVVVFSILGIICTVVSAVTCEYFDFENPRPFEQSGFGIVKDGSLGLYSFHNGGQCVDYGTYICVKYDNQDRCVEDERVLLENDANALAAKVGVIAAFFAAVITTLLILFEAFVIKFRCDCSFLVASGYFVALLGQSITFTFFGTQDLCEKNYITCKLAPGSIVSIAGCCFYFIVSIMVWFLPDGEPYFSSKNDATQEQEQLEESSDWEESNHFSEGGDRGIVAMVAHDASEEGEQFLEEGSDQEVATMVGADAREEGEQFLEEDSEQEVATMESANAREEGEQFLEEGSDQKVATMVVDDAREDGEQFLEEGSDQKVATMGSANARTDREQLEFLRAYTENENGNPSTT